MKFRWAFGCGVACRRVGDRGGGPFGFRPVSRVWRSRSASLACAAAAAAAASHFGLRLQGGLRIPDLGEAALPAGQFGGEFVPPLPLPVLGVLGGIDPLGLGQEGGDLLLQLPLRLGHAAVAHRLVLGGVGQDLRAVEGHVAELHQAGPLAEAEHLDEQRGEGRQVASAGRPAMVSWSGCWFAARTR